MNIWYGTNQCKILSNLHYRPFVGPDDRSYISVEHAYQTWKSGSFDEATYNKKWKCGSKFFGRKAKTEDDYNLILMKKIIKRSLLQNEDVLTDLQKTKGVKLTHKQDDGIWKTEFPKILMELREEI